VKDQSVAAVGGDEAELPAPPERGDGRAGQPLAEIGREGPPQVRPPKLDSGNSPPEQHLLKTSDGRFDFGKLGHHRDMANVGAAS
jgi:hypothetical protein